MSTTGSLLLASVATLSAGSAALQEEGEGEEEEEAPAPAPASMMRQPSRSI